VSRDPDVLELVSKLVETWVGLFPSIDVDLDAMPGWPLTG
jgi:hypothetical protein